MAELRVSVAQPELRRGQPTAPLGGRDERPLEDGRKLRRYRRRWRDIMGRSTSSAAPLRHHVCGNSQSNGRDARGAIL